MDDIINSLNAENRVCEKFVSNNGQSKLKFLEAEILKLRNENTSLKDDNKSKLKIIESLAGDLNIDILEPSKDTSNHLPDLLNVFNLKNFVKKPTCFMSDKWSLIDIILTNKPRSFHKTQGFVTGISDFHKLVVTVLRSYYKNFLQRIFYIVMLKGLKKISPSRLGQWTDSG